MSEMMSDLNLPYQKLEAKVQRQIAEFQAPKKPEPTEKSMKEEDERISRLVSHLDPPGNCLEPHYGDLISRQKHPGHLIAFYTSVATLRVSYSVARNIRPGFTL